MTFLVLMRIVLSRENKNQRVSYTCPYFRATSFACKSCRSYPHPQLSAKQSRIEKLKLEKRKLEAERDGLKQVIPKCINTLLLFATWQGHRWLSIGYGASRSKPLVTLLGRSVSIATNGCGSATVGCASDES